MAQVTSANVISDASGKPTAIGNYAYITLAGPTTTLVKSGAGFLLTLTMNTPASSGVVKLYDGLTASGTLFAILSTSTSYIPVSMVYNLYFVTGLCIVTSGAAQDITVTYR